MRYAVLWGAVLLALFAIGCGENGGAATSTAPSTRVADAPTLPPSPPRPSASTPLVPTIQDAAPSPRPLSTASAPSAPPEEEATPAPQPSPPTPTDGNITLEEDLSINPPPPQNVRVTGVTSRSVRLAWDPPPPVTVPHPYSDVVVAYRVFRRGEGELEFRPLAETAEAWYTDEAVQPGRTYEYVVSSIREQNAEGGRSDPPAVTRTPN